VFCAPPHVPAVAVSVNVRCVVPVMVGGAVAVGGSQTTGPIDSLVTATCPYALIAVTVTRTRAPRSAVVSV
jgi:hypothetical protein